MTTIVEAALPAQSRHMRKHSTPVVLAVLHPKGGVGRSTTVWQLGAELALRAKHVRIEDLDQGAHLSRTFSQYPLGLEHLQLAGAAAYAGADVILLDTAPEAQRERAIEVLRRADWAIVPVKGPEASSVQALPMLMQWIAAARHARVLGFLPTMYKPRRAETRYWMGELEAFAERHSARVCSPPSETSPAWPPGVWMAIRTRPSPRKSCVSPRTAGRPSLADFEVAAVAVPPVDDRLVHQPPIDSIRRSTRNPRQRVDGIAELADSLRAHGLLQPVVVRRHGAAFELIAGHRRLEAAKVIGWTEIAAVVRDESDDQAYILTLVENLQREDLTPKEEAAALEVLVRERGWTTRQVCEAVKRSHIYVSRRLRVFEDPVLAPLVLERKLPVSTAEELLRAPDAESRKDLAEQAAERQWTWAEARHAVADLGTGRSKWADLARHLRPVLEDAPQVDRSSLSAADRKLVSCALSALRRLL